MVKIRPPFTWFGRYTAWLSGGSLLVVAAMFRLWRLDTLPPGLYTGEAKIGSEALRLALHGQLPALTSSNDYSALWVWLQALSVKLLGHTPLALRLWPAILGIAAVMVTWLWAKTWFGARIGWLAAFLMAVTPWTVTLSRNAESTALIMLLVPLTFWVATWTYHRQNLLWHLLLAATLTLDLLAGPLGWLLTATTIGIGTVMLFQRHELFKFNRARLVGLGALVIGLGLTAWSFATSLAALAKLPGALGLGAKTSFFATLLMFNLHGDENFRHNFGAEPLLNAFVGLMFVAGVLVTISRLGERRYQILGIGFVALLLPAALSTIGAPNAARAVGAMPVIFVLAAIGISYMLELWYATFPINSAARTTGQSVMLLLLILTLFQGYAQYFRAWANSAETYAAYDEPAVAAAKYIRDEQKPAKPRFFVGSVDEIVISQYLDDGTSFTTLEPKGIAGLPLLQSGREFIITAGTRDEAVKNLSLKFPGGKLKPHLSPFSQNEIYYTYEAAQ